VAVVRTNVLEIRIISIIRVKRIATEAYWKETLKEVHVVASWKTAFFIVTAMKTLDLPTIVP
jgi:hypothetical protein